MNESINQSMNNIAAMCNGFHQHPLIIESHFIIIENNWFSNC